MHKTGGWKTTDDRSTMSNMETFEGNHLGADVSKWTKKKLFYYYILNDFFRGPALQTSSSAASLLITFSQPCFVGLVKEGGGFMEKIYVTNDYVCLHYVMFGERF